MNKYISLILFCCVLFTAYGAPPNWEVDATKYQSSMNVICVAEINGSEIRSTNVKVAAFCRDECRGIATPIYNVPLNRYYFFLSIMGENVKEDIELSIYDGDADKVYAIDDKLGYVKNQLLGNPFNPVVLKNAINKSDYLLTSFQSERQVMDCEIIGDSLIRIYHSSNTDLSSGLVWFNAPASLFILKLNNDTLKSGQSNIDLTKPVSMQLYTPDGQLVQTYTVELLLSYPVSNVVLHASDIDVYNTGNILFLDLQQRGRLQSYKIWNMNGAIVQQGVLAGSKAEIQIRSTNGEMGILELFFQTANAKTERYTAKLLLQ